jgi:hypothetical protein
MQFNCYYIPEHTKLEGISPDDPRMAQFGDWTVYHTDRAGGRFITKKYISEEGRKRYDGVTDEKNLIVTVPVTGVNCHGYTFIDSWVKYSIVGYEFPQDKIEHRNADLVDQGTAAQFILRDNGYHQVHAKGSNDTIGHFKLAYEVDQFARRLPEPQP